MWKLIRFKQLETLCEKKSYENAKEFDIKQLILKTSQLIYKSINSIIVFKIHVWNVMRETLFSNPFRKILQIMYAFKLKPFATNNVLVFKFNLVIFRIICNIWKFGFGFYFFLKKNGCSLNQF